MSDAKNEEDDFDRFHSSIIIYFDEFGAPVVKLGDVHPLTAIALFKVLIHHLETVLPDPEIWHGDVQLDTYPFEFEDDEDRD